MSKLRIVTNNQPRLIINWDELTDAEREWFDYIDPEDQPGRDFVRYKGQAYDLGDMERSTVAGWDIMHGDSYFSGVLFRYPREEWGGWDTDHIICGYYLC